jgi:hypothetical protein
MPVSRKCIRRKNPRGKEAKFCEICHRVANWHARRRRCYWCQRKTCPSCGDYEMELYEAKIFQLSDPPWVCGFHLHTEERLIQKEAFIMQREAASWITDTINWEVAEVIKEIGPLTTSEKEELEKLTTQIQSAERMTEEKKPLEDTSLDLGLDEIKVD